MSKSMTKSTFLRFSLSYAYWEVKHPYFTFEYLSLFHKSKSLMTRRALTFKHNNEIFIWKTRVFQFQLCPNNTGTEKVWFGHAFRCWVTNFNLNPIYSAPKSRNWGLPEDFKTHPTFIPGPNFETFFGTPCRFNAMTQCWFMSKDPPFEVLVSCNCIVLRYSSTINSFLHWTDRI